jgi:hypothetical protein
MSSSLEIERPVTRMTGPSSETSGEMIQQTLNVNLVTNSKLCSKCRTEKPVVEFGKRTTSRDGLQSRCKECARAYEKARNQKPERKQYLSDWEAYNRFKRNGQKQIRRAIKRQEWLLDNDPDFTIQPYSDISFTQEAVCAHS